MRFLFVAILTMIVTTSVLCQGLSEEEKKQMEKMAAQRASQLASRKELEDSFQAGLKALSAKQYETAIHLLSRASELDPKQSAIWANLADANSGLAGTKSGTDRNSLY